jgi:hypothetical protein
MKEKENKDGLLSMIDKTEPVFFKSGNKYDYEEDYKEVLMLLDESIVMNKRLLLKIQEITKTCGNGKFRDKSEQHGYNMAAIEFLRELHSI